MDYRNLLGIDRETARIGVDMSRLSAGFSVRDQIASMVDLGINQATKQAFTSVADELTRSMFNPPLDVLKMQMVGLGLDSVVRDSFVAAGTSLTGLTAQIAQLQSPSFQIPDLGSLFPSIEVGRFIRPLPDLGPLVEWAENTAAEKGADALDEGGYGFAEHLFTQRFLAGMAWIAPQARGAAVTNRLLGYTRQDRFRQELLDQFHRSSFLRRRSSIVERAILAHRDKDYILAIPTLLAQVEGAIGDALVLKKSAVAKGHKLYEKGINGKPKLKSNGNPIEIPGGKRLLQVCDLSEHPLLIAVSDVLMKGLLDKRNGIMHGRDTRYPRAGLSLQALLILLVVAPDIVAFEAGDIELDPPEST